MRAVTYNRTGAASDVLEVVDVDTPPPGPGEAAIKVAVSGINAGDIKKRADTFGLGMAFPTIIPHSDGAGVVETVGEGVPGSWIGKRVWCFGAQSYRQFGTAAQHCIVPIDKLVELPDEVSFSQGANLGIPGMTAHRAVTVAGPVEGKILLVHGGAGAVGNCAIALARAFGAKVLTTVRREEQVSVAEAAGANYIFVIHDNTLAEIQSVAPDGVDLIVDVSFGANMTMNTELLANDGAIAAYASDVPDPDLNFWPLLFKNAAIFLLGSDDFPHGVKRRAAVDLNRAATEGWLGLPIVTGFDLDECSKAHQMVEGRTALGRVVLYPNGPEFAGVTSQ